MFSGQLAGSGGRDRDIARVAQGQVAGEVAADAADPFRMRAFVERNHRPFAIANILEKLEADTLQAPGLSLQPIRRGEYLLLQRWPMCGTAPRFRRTSRLHRIVRNEDSRLDPEVGRQLPDVVQVDFPVSGPQLRHRRYLHA